MKTKFWTGYLLTMLFVLSGVYFVTAQMSDVPLVLSDTKMEQLSGTLTDWDCIKFSPCANVPCNNNNLMEVRGISGCYSCETSPNLTCFYKDVGDCDTCVAFQYEDRCGGDLLRSLYTTYRECE